VAAQSGEAVLAGGRRGRRAGGQKALSAAPEEGLRGLIARRCPDQYGLSFALGTRQVVRALIARETGVWLSLPAVGDYLRGWGFTAQRSMRRRSALRQAQEAGRGGTGMAGEHCPAVARRARAQGGDIHWAGKTGLSNPINYGRSFAPEDTSRSSGGRPNVFHTR
jgi:hypothetical protein